MLENLRKQGASAFIWVVFAILIGMFVINFGPQSQGASCSLGGGQKIALKVSGHEVDEAGLRLMINLGGYFERGGESDGQARKAMERLIIREILASEAQRRGLRVPEGLVDEAITRGKIHLVGDILDARGLYFSRLDDEDESEDLPTDPDATYFDARRFRMILRNMGISVDTYKREQAREVLASTMKRILINGVPASREEALAQFVADNTRVSFHSVRFDSSKYANALLLTDKDLDRFIRANPEELRAAYVADAWKGKKQVHVRRIFVPRTTPAAAPNPTTQPADGSGGPAPATAAPDPARARLAALREQIAAGKRGFTEAAERTESDPQLAARGGDWGWYDEGVFTLPEVPLNEAAKALVPGKVSEVIDGAEGYFLLIIDDQREGDLTFEQVQRELAMPIARHRWGKEAARRAALKALADLQASKKTLADAFPEQTKTGSSGPLTIVSDRPVRWGQAGEGSATGTAAPAPAAADGAAAGTAAGTAAGGAAPAADGAAAGQPPAPAGPPPIMTPSTDVLPEMAKVEPPEVQRHDGMVRAGDATPIGESEELVTALFDRLAVGDVADRIFEVRASVIDPMPQYALVQVTAKNLADIAEFDKQSDRLVERLAVTRGYQLFAEWVRERCLALAQDGKIKPTLGYLQTFDDQGRRLPVSYRPCESMQLPE